MSNTIAIHIGSQNSAASYGDDPIIPLICGNQSTLNTIICYNNFDPYLQPSTNSIHMENFIRYPLRLFDLSLNNFGNQAIKDLSFGSPVIQYNNTLFFHLANGTMKSCDDVITDIIRYIYKEALKMNNKINSLALTIPTYYSYQMRERLKACIKRAGYSCSGLFTEAECLVLKQLYSHKDPKFEEDNYFVLLLGASICEGSFIKVCNGCLIEYPIFYKRNLGGNKVDELLLQFCDDELKKKGIDLYEGNKKENLVSLLDSIRAAKEMILEDECIYFNNVKGKPSVPITETTYIELITPIIEAIKKSIIEGFIAERDRMEDPDISIDKITKVIFLGGMLSSEQPFRSELMKLFPVKLIDCAINHELEGCLLHLQRNKSTTMVLKHPLTYSIGVGLDSNRAKRMISAGMLLPTNSSLIWRQNDVLKQEVNTAIFYGDMFISTPLLTNMKRLMGIREKSEVYAANNLYKMNMELSSDGVLTVFIASINNRILFTKSITLPFY